MIRRVNKGSVYAMMSSFFLAGSLILSNHLVKSLNPRMLAFVFFGTVYATTAVILLYKERGNYFKLIRENWKDGLIVGGFNAMAATFFFLALESLEVSTIAFMTRFSTIFIIIIGIFYFKEKLTRFDVIGSIIAIAGALIINLNIGSSRGKIRSPLRFGCNVFSSLCIRPRLKNSLRKPLPSSLLI